RPYRHWNSFAARGRNAAPHQRLKCFVRWHEIAVNVWGYPAVPERRKWIGQKRVASNSKPFLLDKPLNEMIQHRMHRQNDVRTRGFDEPRNVAPDFEIKKFTLVRTRAI